MAPSAYEFLEAFPLTPNKKIDRKALPAPQAGGRTSAAQEHVAPRSPTEHALAAIWESVLGVQNVGVTDDFFRLGGHSLIAMRIVTAARDTFRMHIPLKALFAAPTVEGLAKFIQGSELGEADSAQLAAALSEVESLTDDEVRSLLAELEAGAGLLERA
jgi:acyl carrier protein